MQNETRSCRCPKEHAEIWLSPPCDSDLNIVAYRVLDAKAGDRS